MFVRNCKLENSWLGDDEFFAYAVVIFKGIRLKCVRLVKIRLEEF